MSHKDVAVSFLQHAASGDLGDVFSRDIAPGFRHHNPWFASDGESLRKAMEDNARKNPGKRITVHRVIEEGDFVAVHSHVRHNAGEAGYALVHIFRFEGGRIAELWDLAMEVPAESPNRAGMF